VDDVVGDALQLEWLRMKVCDLIAAGWFGAHAPVAVLSDGSFVQPLEPEPELELGVWQPLHRLPPVQELGHHREAQPVDEVCLQAPCRPAISPALRLE
jgi:hypothetical protein